MSHIVEEYAKNLGVRVGHPVLDRHFYPLPVDKYITIDSSHNLPACQYPYWAKVIEALRVSLNDKEIRIVRIISPDDKTTQGEDLSISSLTIKQINYVISNSLFHFNTGSFTSHMAAAYDIPQVSIYSNMLAEYIRPIKTDRSMNIQAELKNNKPSFSAQEKDPVINSVFPDKIISAANFLEPNLISPPDTKVIRIGNLYNHNLFEIVPDFWHDVPELRGRLLNVRMDFHFNEKILESWLKTNHCSLITDRQISIDLIRKYKRNVPFINFFNKSGSFPDKKYLEELKKAGVQFKLYSEEKRSDKFNAELNKYFDFDFVQIDRPAEWPEGVTDETLFSTNKIIYCKDGLYLSKAHMDADNRGNNVIKSLDFLKEIEHFYLYGK
jgi:hypothetical protein